MKQQDYLVTVCKSCQRITCWHGIFYCDDYKTANIIEMWASELKKLGLEHPDHYSRREIARHTGVMPKIVKR